jgi:hypothetical protein
VAAGLSAEAAGGGEFAAVPVPVVPPALPDRAPGRLGGCHGSPGALLRRASLGPADGIFPASSDSGTSSDV